LFSNVLKKFFTLTSENENKGATRAAGKEVKMARKIKNTWTRIERDPITDVIGGVWLVTLLLSLPHLPGLLA